MPGNKSKLNSGGEMKQSCYIHVRPKTVRSDQAAQKTRLVTIMGIKYVRREKKHQTLKTSKGMDLKMVKYLLSLPMSLHSLFSHFLQSSVVFIMQFLL